MKNKALIKLVVLSLSLTLSAPGTVHAANPVGTTSGDGVAGAVMPYAIEDFYFAPHKESDLPAEIIAEQKFYVHGLGFITQKNIAGGRSFAHQAIGAHPRWCAPYVLMGRLADNIYEDEEGLKYYQKAVELRPECALPWRELGWSLYRQTRYKESIEAVDKGLKLAGNPKCLNMHDVRRQLLKCKAANMQALGRYAEAVICVEQVHQIEGGKNVPSIELAEAYFNARQYDRLIAFTSGWLSKDPNYLDYYYWRGLAYAATGQNQKGIKDLSRFLKDKKVEAIVASKEHLARETRAQLYQKTGQKALAAADLNVIKRFQQDAYNNTIFRDRRK